MKKEWNTRSLRELAFAYQPSAILLAAAELDIFRILAREPLTAQQLAASLGTDPRATTILADALASIGLLDKQDGLYSPAEGTVDTLAADGAATLLPFMRHHANALRAWAKLADVVDSGRPAMVTPSTRGAEADHVAYVETMDVNARHAAEVIAALGPIEFQHMLDVGCGPGTWSIAFLRAVPGARATLYDLPEVIPITRGHVEAAGLADRVTFVSGDYRIDEALPAGADVAWVSAVPHQNSREQNRELFAKVHAALRPGGHIMIREIVMDEDHTAPLFGSMFAVLMLVRTETGNTFSFSELEEDLEAAGFEVLELFPHKHDLDSIIRARRKD